MNEKTQDPSPTPSPVAPINPEGQAAPGPKVQVLLLDLELARDIQHALQDLPYARARPLLRRIDELQIASVSPR